MSGFLCVYQVVGFQQDPVLQICYIMIRVMVFHQIDNLIHKGDWQIKRSQEFSGQRTSLLFLQSAIGTSILLTAQWTGDIMKDGSGL